MSEERHFDDYIRNEFKKYSPTVPARVWENIIAERKDRKPVGFWLNLFSGSNLIWLIGLIVAGTTGAIIIAKKTTSPSETAIASINTTNNNLSSTTVITNKDNSNKPSITSIDNKTSSATTNKSVDVTNNTINGSTNSITTNSTLSSSSNLKNGLDAHQNNIGKTQTTNSDNLIAITNTTGKRAIGRHSARIHIRNTSGKATDTDESASGVNSNNNITSEEDNTVEGRNQIFTHSSKTIDNNTSKRLEFEKAMLLSLNTKQASSSLRQKNLPECPTIEKEASGNKRYIEVYISPDFALRSLKDTGNTAYLQKRLASTKVVSAFSAGVRYTKVFNNSTSIRFGLNFSQINESFTYIQGNIVQTTFNIDPVTGDTTGSYTVRGSRYKTSYNHYRNLDIPVTIGYELGNGRFHANINAGLIANIYSWQTGNELDTNAQPVSITTNKGPAAYQFRTNIGLGATAGASIYYKVTDQIHLMAEPYIRYNFQPLSRDNITLSQKYTTIGIRLGLRFDLHNPGSIINK